MSDTKPLPGGERPSEKMAGHWVLARLGKKVLRPGGKKLTEAMLHNLQVTSDDDVVEFAPGLGFTARLCLQRQPNSYTAIEQNPDAANIVRGYLEGDSQRCHQGSAEETGLESGQASVVYGEAMLTMQSDAKKAAIIAEAARILRPGGRYGIHELCIVPDDIDQQKKREIQKAIADAIMAPAKPLTPNEWADQLQVAGLQVGFSQSAGMELLEPRRMISDEGVLGALKVAANMIRDKQARLRALEMRKVFSQYKENLAAVVMVAHCQEKQQEK